MRIELTKKFFIEQCLHAPFCWDLMKVSYGNRGGKENVRVETPVAYGLTLEHLMKKIADYEIFESEKDLKTFEDYIKEYKKISEKAVKELINNLKK